MKKLIVCAVLMLAMTGCSTMEAPTESKISFVPTTGAMTWALPKDASWSWMHFTQDIVNPTNRFTNHVSLVISNGVFKNNPLVLDAKTRHDIGIITATGQQLQGAIQAGVGAAGKAVVP